MKKYLQECFEDAKQAWEELIDTLFNFLGLFTEENNA